ncbi:MAG: type I methionyl aminopeptidase, partial [Oscillospiraceae bacterium]|nr:type I methionyl aminopeptidase [Oscillospiraceae bacterium]
HRILKEGDIVSVDVGAFIDGFTGDNAATFPVGEISEEAKKLLRITKESLDKAVEVCIAGNRLGDIGSAVQDHVESNGFSIVREYVGHGVGRDLHEDPEVPNYGRAGHGVRLVPGMTIAIEPMVNADGPEVEVLANDWTVVTVDRQLSAHFEYTVAITESGPVIMTRV